MLKHYPDEYVTTGPGFPDGITKTIGPGHVAVPQQLYKVDFVPKAGKMGAWILPNADVPKDHWNDYCTSVAKVEAMTGLTFFPKMDPAQKAALAQMSCAL